MDGASGAHTVKRLRTMAGTASVAVAAVAALALAGWWLDAPLLMAWRPGGVAMNPLTALAFIATGGALWLVRGAGAGGWWRRGVTVLAAAVLTVAVVRLAGDLAGAAGGLDTWLAGGRSDPSGISSRMAPNTALTFVLLSLALLLLDVLPRSAAAAATGALLIAGLALTGYGFGGAPLTGLRGFIPMALNTSAAFVAAAVGVLLARPDRDPLRLLLDDGPGSVMARRLLPWALGAVVATGLLLRTGLAAGWFDVGLAMALLVAGLVVAVAGVILWAAGVANRVDADRRRFFELSQDMLAVADFSGHFVELNPQWERVLGWSRSELMERPFKEFVHPDDVAPTLGQYDQSSAGDPVVRFTNRYRTRSGDYRWLEWCATTVPALHRSFAVARDVTDLRRLDRELERRVAQLHDANQELEAFSYSASHDLRAPLRHISGFANLLAARGDNLGEDARRWLGIIQTSTRHMGALIDDLLAFSHIGRAPLTATPVDLTALVADVWNEQRALAAGRDVQWRLRQLPWVLGDAALLRVAFTNLVSNAVKYSAKRPVAEITVDGKVEDGIAVVTVRDNGVGFDMRYADKLFGVFQRLHSSDDFEGTGIGLATVRRIVARHGGSITATAEPDRGATFRLVLPAAEPAAGDAARVPPPAAEPAIVPAEARP